MPARRTFLMAGGAVALAGVAVGLVEARVLPGRTRLHELLGLTGEDGVMPDVAPGERLSGASTAMPSRAPGSTASSPQPSPAECRLSRSPRSTGGDGFWHPRTSGDFEGMLFGELLPRLSTAGLSTARIGLLGFSMGGFGVLSMAGRHRDTVTAAVAVSPAVWRDFGEALPGAFDDAAAFARHDLFPRRGELSGLPLRVDCGDDGPFAPNVADYLDGLPAIEGCMQPGLHTDGFLHRVAPAGLAFLGERLRT